MHKLITILLLFTAFNSIYGQSLSLNGVVYDSRMTPIEGVIVSVFKDTLFKDVISYKLTDAKGTFHFKLEGKLDVVHIQASSLGFKTSSVTLSLPYNDRVTFVLTDDTTELQEVVVKVSKVKDTVGVNTTNMNLTDNSSLRDILNQADGFMITKEGGISYNGIPIKKILINKKEVFIDQNKIALDNLTNEIIDSLQVISNYRDKFNINFNNFTSTVLNINAKKQFTGVLKTSVGAGYGFKNAYQVKPKSMFFSDKINLFSTLDINNIGEKDFSSDDVLAPLVDKTNSYLKSLIIPFFIDDDLLKKDVTGNLSITSRHQSEKNKMGIVVQYNYINKIKETFSTGRFLNPDVLTKQEVNQLNDVSKFYTVNYYYSKLLGAKTSLNYHFDLLQTKGRSNNFLEVLNYIPDTNRLVGAVSKKPDGYIFSNSVDLMTLYKKKFLLKANFNYYKQNSSYNLLADYSNMDTSVYYKQQLKFKTDAVSFHISSKYMVSELMTLEFRPQLFFYNDQNQGFVINKRHLLYFIPLISLGGQKRGTYYNIEFAPESYNFLNNYKRNDLYRFEVNLERKLNSSSVLTAKLSNRNNTIDFYNFVDTLVSSYNSRIITKDISHYNISQNQLLRVGYYYTNIIKSTSFNLIADFTKVRNSLQNYFQTIDSSNVYYYRNVIVPFKKAIDIKSTVGKGFYITGKNHKINLKVSAGYNGSTMPFFNFVSPKELIYKSTAYTYGSQISFQYNSKFVSEFKFVYNGESKVVSLDGGLFKYRSDLWGVELFSHNDKIEVKSALYYLKNYNATYSFNTPILNLSASYKLSDKIFFFINGKALIDLLDLRSQPYTSYNIVTQGSLVNEYFNKYRISNFILGATYKF